MTELHILHIYPDEMNTYGDRGNLLCLKRRAEWHGLKPVIHYHHTGNALPKQIDIVLGGGGQDSAQDFIHRDIMRIGGQLRTLISDGIPMLMVCGTYQLFGKRFITNEGVEIEGIGVFDVETVASSKRLVGNVTIDTSEFGTLYGFENHSGRTLLGSDQAALGTVMYGNGNNGDDKTEGARTNNAIGTYMHGPLLPTNPVLADRLIRISLDNKGVKSKLLPIDEQFVVQARLDARQRNK